LGNLWFLHPKYSRICSQLCHFLARILNFGLQTEIWLILRSLTKKLEPKAQSAADKNIFLYFQAVKREISSKVLTKRRENIILGLHL